MAHHEQSADFLNFLQQYAQPPDSSYCSRYTGLDYLISSQLLAADQSSWNHHHQTFECGDIGDEQGIEERSCHDLNSFLQQDSISHDIHNNFSLGGHDIIHELDPSSIYNDPPTHHDYSPNHTILSQYGVLLDDVMDYSTKSMIMNHQVFPTPNLFESTSIPRPQLISTPSTSSNYEPNLYVDLNASTETTSFSPKANSIPPSSILATKVYNNNIEQCNKLELGMEMIMLKRPRMEIMPSPMPTFKVRKEKLGDRVTALQQLVSPFGKTDTASVLHEATKYIKFLHNQVISATNINDSINPIQPHQMNTERWDRDKIRRSSGLRSRGLCLVPISTTFQIAYESSNSPDYWTTMFD